MDDTTGSEGFPRKSPFPSSPRGTLATRRQFMKSTKQPPTFNTFSTSTTAGPVQSKPRSPQRSNPKRSDLKSRSKTSRDTTQNRVRKSSTFRNTTTTNKSNNPPFHSRRPHRGLRYTADILDRLMCQMQGLGLDKSPILQPTLLTLKSDLPDTQTHQNKNDRPQQEVKAFWQNIRHHLRVDEEDDDDDDGFCPEKTNERLAPRKKCRPVSKGGPKVVSLTGWRGKMPPVLQAAA